MKAFDVSEAARRCGGRLEGPGTAPVVRVTLDSRETREGDLFVALPGEHTHGNAFVQDALERGAVAAIVGPGAQALPPEFADRALIRVKYPRKSLADLAAAHRRSLTCPVIAITGSNGKSSVREMVAAVLEPLGPVVQAEKSYNNELGLPLTILRAGPDTAALVLEMGSSGRGEIRHLCGIARPDVAVITNVAPAHLAGLGDEDGVAREKRALAECLPAEGALVLNADDERVRAMASRTRTERVVHYGFDRRHATVWGHRAERTVQGVDVWLYGKMRLSLPVAGLHNAHNALAAAAVGLLFGVAPDRMQQALASVRLPSMRMQQLAFGGVTLFLDCYNANPASLRVAVEELQARSGDGRRVVVMGDMRELGPRSVALHRAAGAELAERADVLWFVGPDCKDAYDAALEAGMHPDQTFWSPTSEAAVQDPCVKLVRGDVVLFKGSRALRLELLVDALGKELTGPREAAAEAAEAGEAAREPAPAAAEQRPAGKVG